MKIEPEDLTAAYMAGRDSERKHQEQLRDMDDTARLVSFGSIPIGHRFRYPSSSQSWTVIDQYRNHTDDEPMSGTIAKYESGLSGRASLCSHIGGDDECPDMVYLLD